MKRYVILFTLSAFVLIGCSPKIAGIQYFDGSVYAVTDSEELYVWGKNDKGQLGTGDKENKDKPVKILNTVHMSGIKYHDGSVFVYDGENFLAWGNNADGRLGVGKGKEKEVLTPTIIELKGESFFDKLSDDDNTNE